MLSRPDIVVLGGGGVLGEAWMTGVLSGIEERAGFDLRRCEYFVGTSAGAIVAARLAAGESPRRPPLAGHWLVRAPEARELEGELIPSLAAGALGVAERAGAWALALTSPLAPLSLSLTKTSGALARTAVLRALGRPARSLAGLRNEIEATGASFDGRLRITAVERATGRRVVFGRPSAPDATVAEAVEASCTVPWLFAPVAIGGTEYVDGGIWSPTNLDAAPAGRGSLVLCLNPTAGLAGPHPLLTLARGATRTAMSVEAAALRSRGADVRLIGPDAASAAAIGTDLMARGPAAAVLAAGFAQGLALVAAQGAPTSSAAGAGRSRRRRALDRART